MLTALFSLISGLISGLAPDIMKEVRESRASKREREFLEAQHRWQMEAAAREADGKLREQEHSQLLAEIQAMRDQMLGVYELTGRPSGFGWIDGFNALLRPVAVVGIMVLFFWVSAAYVDATLTHFDARKLTLAQLDAAIWSSLLGESFLAALGFLFGYRSARKV